MEWMAVVLLLLVFILLTRWKQIGPQYRKFTPIHFATQDVLDSVEREALRAYDDCAMYTKGRTGPPNAHLGNKAASILYWKKDSPGMRVEIVNFFILNWPADIYAITFVNDGVSLVMYGEIAMPVEMLKTEETIRMHKLLEKVRQAVKSAAPVGNL